MKKLLSIFKYALLAISVITLALIFLMTDNNGIDLAFYWTYTLLALAILVSILGPVINLLRNPKGAMRSLVGIGVVVVVLGVAYALSSAEPVVNPGGGYFEDPFELKFTDTQLYTTYIALAGAIIAAVVGEIWHSLIKR